MPNRYLREGILTSERVDKLQPQAEVFYRRLMSVVDDYGRFDANPKLLRASCYPLRVDAVREADISRWLTEVESAGLIALYAVNGKNYVELRGLGEPRAKFSKFPAPCASANKCAQTRTSAPITSSITITPSPSVPIKPNARAHSSRPETEPETEKEKRVAGQEIEIPRALDSPEFRAAWAEFCQHRLEIHHRLRPTAARKQLKNLESMGAARAIAAIDHSISNGWQGIFEPARKDPPNGKSSIAVRRDE
jgi:hypothetical protein